MQSTCRAQQGPEEKLTQEGFLEEGMGSGTVAELPPQKPQSQVAKTRASVLAAPRQEAATQAGDLLTALGWPARQAPPTVPQPQSAHSSVPASAHHLGPLGHLHAVRRMRLPGAPGRSLTNPFPAWSLQGTGWGHTKQVSPPSKLRGP